MIAASCALPPAFSAENLRVFILLSAPNKIYSQIAEGLKENSEWTFTEAALAAADEENLTAVLRADPHIVVAVGDAAAAWAEKADLGVPVVVSGVVTQSNPALFRKMSGVSIDFTPSAYLKIILEFLPDAKRVGLVYNPLHDSRFAADLTSAAERLGLSVAAIPVRKERSLGKAMESVKLNKADIFLMTYDPLVMNPESWQYLVGFSINNRIGLIVPSRALLKNGGVISLEADYLELGRQTKSAVRRAAAGASGVIEPPGQGEIGVNFKMANILGITIPDGMRKKVDYPIE